MSFFSQPEILSVSEVTGQIKTLLENEFRFVHISGEVSNLRQPYSGHQYFTLKDSSAQLKAVLFKGQQKFLSDSLRDGIQVICHGRISVYDPRGEYQLIVDTVDFHGSGALYEEFERLKKKLRDEGLFDEQKKSPIPAFPKEIVVVTSPSGAAIRDFLKIHQLRRSNCNISLYPVRVQGEGSGNEISNAISHINQQLSPDILVLMRGGGSIEDLWAFNEECVARAIADSTIPVVTGIGHEIDFTIADFCSDLRMPTPTAVAEHLLFNRSELFNTIQGLEKRILRSLSTNISISAGSVKECRRRILNLEPLFTRYSLDIDYRSSRLLDQMNNRLLAATNSLEKISLLFSHQAPHLKIKADLDRLTLYSTRLKEMIEQTLSKNEYHFKQQLSLLDAVSPLATLARGYSIARKKHAETGRYTIISNTEQLKQNDNLEIILHRGQIDCNVVGISKNSLSDLTRKK